MYTNQELKVTAKHFFNELGLFPYKFHITVVSSLTYDHETSPSSKLVNTRNTKN